MAAFRGAFSPAKQGRMGREGERLAPKGRQLAEVSGWQRPPARQGAPPALVPEVPGPRPLPSTQRQGTPAHIWGIAGVWIYFPAVVKKKLKIWKGHIIMSTYSKHILPFPLPSISQ